MQKLKAIRKKEVFQKMRSIPSLNKKEQYLGPRDLFRIEKIPDKKSTD